MCRHCHAARRSLQATSRDLVALKVRDLYHGDQVASRAVVMQHKTGRPVQFEIAAGAGSRFIGADNDGLPGLGARPEVGQWFPGGASGEPVDGQTFPLPA